jgi:hypothetical protein
LHSFLVSIPLAIVLWALRLLGVAVTVVLMGRPRDSAAPATGRSRAAGPAARSRGSAAPPPARSGAAGSAVPWWRAVDAAAARSRAGRTSVAHSAAADPVAADSAADLAAYSLSDDPDARSVDDDLRFADEVAVAAEHAAATAARGRADWEAAERELDAAWAAYQEADAAARRIWAATSFPLMSRRRRLGENADRERYLHRAATAACRRRELSIGRLNDVYAHRGWNPRLHPVVQEALLHNAIRENAFARYQAAQRRERAAWQQSEIAAEALRALRAEAAAAFGRTAAEQPAVSEFWWAEPWTTGELPAAA